MFKTCPYCHKIVPANHRCETEQKIRKDRRNQLSRHYNHSSEYKQFIHSSEWTDMRNRVIDRDNGLDQAVFLLQQDRFLNGSDFVVQVV